jgi:hypothetical protein
VPHNASLPLAAPPNTNPVRVGLEIPEHPLTKKVRTRKVSKKSRREKVKTRRRRKVKKTGRITQIKEAK